MDQENGFVHNSSSAKTMPDVTFSFHDQEEIGPRILAWCDAVVDYEHRFAEHEYEYEEMPDSKLEYKYETGGVKRLNNLSGCGCGWQ